MNELEISAGPIFGPLVHGSETTSSSKPWPRREVRVEFVNGEAPLGAHERHITSAPHPP
jgi:hypothetical protein